LGGALLLTLIVAVCWLVMIVCVLAVCRAAGRADAQSERAGRHLGDSARCTRAIGLVTAASALAGTAAAPSAAARTCAAPADDAPTREIAAAVSCRIAGVRADHDLHRLKRQRQLAAAAHRYAADMAQRDFFSHVSPDGARLRDRVLASGYANERCTWHVGEVLAWGTGTDATAGWTVRAWMHSPPHRRVLLGSDYAEIGTGVVRGAPVAMPADVPAITVDVMLGRRDCPS
jgi:uncharacterized protein YkwD